MFVSARISTLFLDNLPPSIRDFSSTRSSSTSLSFYSDLHKHNYKKQSRLQQTCLMKPAPHNFELLFWQYSFVRCLIDVSLPEKWILVQLFFKNFNNWLQNSYFQNKFSLGLIRLIIDNIKNLSSTTHRFSGPDSPMAKMLKKLLLEIFFFFSKIPGYIVLMFLKLNSAVGVCQEFCHSSVLSVQKTAICSKSLLQTFKIFLLMSLSLILCTRLEPLRASISRFMFWQQMDPDSLKFVQFACIYCLSKINFFTAI